VSPVSFDKSPAESGRRAGREKGEMGRGRRIRHGGKTK